MGENKEKPEPPSIYQMRFGNEVQSADSDFSKKSAAAALMAPLAQHLVGRAARLPPRRTF